MTNSAFAYYDIIYEQKHGVITAFYWRPSQRIENSQFSVWYKNVPFPRGSYPYKLCETLEELNKALIALLRESRTDIKDG